MSDTTPNLAALIREHQDKTGDSYMDIARKTGLSKPKIGQLANPANTYLVRPDTLRKLSTGLGIPLATVERAAVRTAGMTANPVEEDSMYRRIVERLQEFCPEDMALVHELVEAVAKHRKG